MGEREREEKAPRDKAYVLTKCESEISLREWRSAHPLGDLMRNSWGGGQAEPPAKPQIVCTQAIQIPTPKYQTGGAKGGTVGSQPFSLSMNTAGSHTTISNMPLLLGWRTCYGDDTCYNVLYFIYSYSCFKYNEIIRSLFVASCISSRICLVKIMA